jgi:hypothetical protein
VIAAHQNMIVTLAFQGEAMNRAGHRAFPIYRNHTWQDRWPAPSDSAHRFAMCILALEAVYDREAQEIGR